MGFRWVDSKLESEREAELIRTRKYADQAIEALAEQRIELRNALERTVAVEERAKEAAEGFVKMAQASLDLCKVVLSGTGEILDATKAAGEAGTLPKPVIDTIADQITKMHEAMAPIQETIQNAKL